MEESILTSVKKVVGLASAYTEFDEDILMHINSTLSTLTQMGVGVDGGLVIQDATPEWSAFIAEDAELYSMVRSYVSLKVKMLFDPPSTSFTINAFNEQLKEYEYRMNLVRESAIIDEYWAAQES